MYTSELPSRLEVNRIFGVVGTFAKSGNIVPHISIKSVIEKIDFNLIRISPIGNFWMRLRMSRTSEMIQSFVNVERVGMALLSNY